MLIGLEIMSYMTQLIVLISSAAHLFSSSFRGLAIKISCGSFVEGFSRSQGIDLWVDMIDYKWVTGRLTPASLSPSFSTSLSIDVKENAAQIIKL